MFLLAYFAYGVVWAACMGVPDRSPRQLSWFFSLVRYGVMVVGWPLCGLVYLLQEG